jgi:hypothetical protein
MGSSTLSGLWSSCGARVAAALVASAAACSASGWPAARAMLANTPLGMLQGERGTEAEGRSNHDETAERQRTAPYRNSSPGGPNSLALPACMTSTRSLSMIVLTACAGHRKR